MYQPYEPPPATEPPPPGLESPLGSPPAGIPVAEPPTPSAVGPLLTVLGLGTALIGFFALPTQRYGPGTGRDVGFVDLHDLTAGYGLDAALPASAASPLARFWWQIGLLIAAAVLTVLTGAICVATGWRARQALGLATAGTAAVTAVLHGLALTQTADFLSIVVTLEPRRSLFHDAGLGPWVGFAGLAATAIGGLLTVLLAGGGGDGRR